MSHGIQCRRCKGTYGTKKEYEKHSCDIVPKEEFKVLQLAKKCYYMTAPTKLGFTMVKSPLKALKFGGPCEDSEHLDIDHINKRLVLYIFPDAKVVRVKVYYDIVPEEDLTIRED